MSTYSLCDKHKNTLLSGCTEYWLYRKMCTSVSGKNFFLRPGYKSPPLFPAKIYGKFRNEYTSIYGNRQWSYFCMQILHNM